jgi:hypothetical protein
VEPLAVVAGPVAHHAPVDPGDAGVHDGVGQPPGIDRQRRVARHPVGVPGTGQQGVAPADQVDVAGHDPTGRRRRRPDGGLEPGVRTERQQQRRRGHHLLRGGPRQRRRRVVGEQGRVTGLDHEACVRGRLGDPRLQVGRQAAVGHRGRDDLRDPAGRQHRRAHVRIGADRLGRRVTVEREGAPGGGDHHRRERRRDEPGRGVAGLGARAPVAGRPPAVVIVVAAVVVAGLAPGRPATFAGPFPGHGRRLTADRTPGAVRGAVLGRLRACAEPTSGGPAIAGRGRTGRSPAGRRTLVTRSAAIATGVGPSRSRRPARAPVVVARVAVRAEIGGGGPAGRSPVGTGSPRPAGLAGAGTVAAVGGRFGGRAGVGPLRAPAPPPAPPARRGPGQVTGTVVAVAHRSQSLAAPAHPPVAGRPARRQRSIMAARARGRVRPRRWSAGPGWC